MEKFTSHTGVGVPLRRSNVDTDQIIPASYLKRVTRTGFEDGLFAAWRNDPGFVLNHAAVRRGLGAGRRPRLRHRLLARARRVGAAELRLPGRASRRGSPTSSAATPARPGWSRRRSTTRSCSGSGTCSRREPGTEVTVDLESRTVRAGEGVDAVEDSFDIDDYTRWRLLEGLDDIGITPRPRRRHRDVRVAPSGWKPATRLTEPLPNGRVTIASAKRPSICHGGFRRRGDCGSRHESLACRARESSTGSAHELHRKGS